MTEFRNVPTYRGGVKVNPLIPRYTQYTAVFLGFLRFHINAINIEACENFLEVSLTALISKACIFDWAGTVCDAGVFAPVLTFQKLFEDEGVPITSQEVREPMGVHKRVSILYYTLY